MRRIGAFVFLLLLSKPAESQDVIVAAYGSSGLNPAMSWSYVCRYPEDLRSADGQRFLINSRIGDEPTPAPLTLVQNFANELRAAEAKDQ